MAASNPTGYKLHELPNTKELRFEPHSTKFTTDVYSLFRLAIDFPLIFVALRWLAPDVYNHILATAPYRQYLNSQCLLHPSLTLNSWGQEGTGGQHTIIARQQRLLQLFLLTLSRDRTQLDILFRDRTQSDILSRDIANTPLGGSLGHHKHAAQRKI
ncbi:permease, Auxin efflux carrier protein-like protein [Corchorus capsularis]|uniref:Permease, Auxin efflux carrier protein-like protein n=1 Tax=Corchorus capsularis TaxID=210143 RepID=A0A1R3HLM8_COCAP|nr:permease, Auxin efflux carrier protein-like protein [Corchorus capsularis]